MRWRNWWCDSHIHHLLGEACFMSWSLWSHIHIVISTLSCSPCSSQPQGQWSKKTRSSMDTHHEHPSSERDLLYYETSARVGPSRSKLQVSTSISLKVGAHRICVTYAHSMSHPPWWTPRKATPHSPCITLPHVGGPIWTPREPPPLSLAL